MGQGREMHKFRHLSVALLSGLLLIGLIVLYGCGGSSGGHSSEPAVDKAIREYEAANTPAEVETALEQIDSAIGVNNPSSPLNDFEMSGDYADFFAEQAAFQKSRGISATVERILAGWRASEDHSFTVPTATFTTDLNADIAQARQSPSGPNAQLILAIDKLAQTLNNGSNSLRADSKTDLLLARLISIWSIEQYGADGDPLTSSRDAEACAACIAAHNAACQASYDRTIAQLQQEREAGMTMMSEALAQGLVTQSEYQQGVQQFTNEYNSKSFQASQALQSCQAGAQAACAAACHEQ
jgi:hypothetical protein